MKKRITTLLVAAITLCLTCTSCITMMAVLAASESGNNISRGQTRLNLTIIQTYNSTEALAITKNYDVVKIETVLDTYYDGKKIKGRFTRVGTHTYENNLSYIKTVPVYVLTSEYNMFKNSMSQ